MILASLGATSGQNEATGFFHQSLSWSPDASRLVFSAMRDRKTDLYAVNIDGSGLTRLTENVGNSVWPDFSPSGRQIAFQSDRVGGQADIWVMNADGGNPIQLTRDSGRNSYPSWSPDGKRIVFTSTRDGGQLLFVMKADGSNPARITSATVDGTKYYNPVWSPKGNRIVFYSDKGDHTDQILVTSPDGSNQKVLTGGIGHNIYPSWLPDGKRIIFSTDRDGVRRMVYLIEADGSDLNRFLGKATSSDAARNPIGDGQGTATQAVDSLNTFFLRWSPDGKRIAYIVGGYPKTQIYVMNADGSGSRLLIK